jgi:DNA polymerase III epsilon subunit-like protein
MILWLDTETTGYNPDKHGIVEMAAIMQDGDGLQVWHSRCNPGDVEYSDDAFSVNKISKAIAVEYPKTARESVTELFLMLRGAVATKKEKFVIAGYNVQFDVKFFRQLAVELGGDMEEISKPFSEDKKYLDVYPMAKGAMKDPKATENHKLRTMLDYFEVEYKPEELHTALGDIRATKALYEVIQGLNGEKK